MSEIDELKRRIAAQEGDIQELRSLLWLNHGHRGALYGDDGELQCGFCGIDFKRMDPTEIRLTFIRRAVLDAVVAGAVGTMTCVPAGDVRGKAGRKAVKHERG